MADKRRVQTNFKAEDMITLESTKDRKQESAQKTDAPKAEAPKQQDSNQVPEGTTAEVLDWVGDDVNKAKKALAAEKKNDDPRVTLTEPLEKIIEDDKQARKEAAAAKKAAEKKAE